MRIRVPDKVHATVAITFVVSLFVAAPVAMIWITGSIVKGIGWGVLWDLFGMAWIGMEGRLRAGIDTREYKKCKFERMHED